MIASLSIFEVLYQSCRLPMTVIFIGLSRPSGTGKTTLAHLLRLTFHNVAHILLADDFSKEFEDIPTVDGYLDYDEPVAVDFVRMAEVLDYIKRTNGTPLSTFSCRQEFVFRGQEEKALHIASASQLDSLRAEV
jgi:uridine kinase